MALCKMLITCHKLNLQTFVSFFAPYYKPDHKSCSSGAVAENVTAVNSLFSIFLQPL